MQARFFQTGENGAVICRLCPHQCKLAAGKTGICGVRQNQQGQLTTLVYELPTAVHVDPIEKKPLFHVFPGSSSFSLATVGCNFHCRFCQNHDISQVHGSISGQRVTADQIVEAALRQGCKTISCTYTEPTIYYEYAYDIARKAKAKGLATVWVTNGYIEEEPLTEIAPFLCAANVDLKGWNESFYRQVIGGELKQVLATMIRMKKLGLWVEVTTLLVPGEITETDLVEIARFIKKELGPETPWHISRFHPQYQYTHVAATSPSAIKKARNIGLAEGLDYVYSGNLPGDEGEHTQCKSCGQILIERHGFQILANRVSHGVCPFCATKVDGVGLDAGNYYTGN